MARDFETSSSHQLNHAAAVTVTMPMTMACWFNEESAVNGTMISICNSGAANTRFELRSGSTGTTVNANQHDNTTNATATTSTTFTTGTWNHGAAVFASTTSRFSYLNGGGAVENTTNVAGSMAGCNQTSIGFRNNSTPATFWDGILAECAIWEVALTAAEIAVLATGASPLMVRPASLLAYWPLIGKYSPEICLINKHDMTVTNATTANHPRIFYPRGRGR